MADADASERQRAILRYLHDHGLALESRRGRRAEFMLTVAGRQFLRQAPLRPPNRG